MFMKKVWMKIAKNVLEYKMTEDVGGWSFRMGVTDLIRGVFKERSSCGDQMKKGKQRRR